jgi:RecA/RadA recombinase
MTATLVGRDAERAVLRDALESALAGHGQVVTISGEAGIGKTALALTLAAPADEQGALWTTGAAWAGGGAPAFWPWNQVLRAIAAELDPDTAREAMGLGAPYLAHLVPQLRRVVPDAGEPEELESDQARFSLFDAVLNFLLAVAEQRPLVILLDDLHAADAPTLRLLDFVARHLPASPVLVLALYQEIPHSEAGGLLADLSRNTRRLPLAGLDRSAIADLVTRRADVDADSIAERIHALTAGNPFFTGELVRLVFSGAGDGPLPLPEGIRATIRRRLEPLSDDTVQILEVASVIGMEFRVRTLGLAASVDRDTLLARLDEAAGAGVVAPSGSGGLDRYAFEHSLIRETLYAGLVPTRRSRAHGDVAGALEQVYADVIDEHLPELSHHLAAADDPRAAELAERAGRHELQRLAFEQAEQHFERALELVRQQDPAGEHAAELLVALGEARMRAGRSAEARQALVQATGIARRHELGELFARATLAMVPWGFNVRVADAELTGLVEEAIERVGEDTPAMRARLLSTLARTTYWTTSLDARQAVVREAVELARESRDDATLARVLGDAHIAVWNPDDNDQSLAWTEEMLAIAERLGARQLALDAHSWRMALLSESGDVAGMQGAFALSARMARESNEPRALALLRRHEAARAVIAGDFDLAGRSLAESAELTNRLGADDMAIMLVAAVTFAVAWHRDELGPLVGAIRDFADANPELPVWRCALAAALARTGEAAEGRRELTAARGRSFEELPRDNLLLVAGYLAAEAAHRLDEREAAGELTRLLAPYAGRNAVTPDGLYFGPVDRARALAAHTAGDTGEAAALLAQARASAQRLGATPVLELLEADAARLGAAPEVSDAPAAPAASAMAALQREGDFWRVGYGAESFLLKDAKGLHHLARLLAQPDVPIHVLDLGAEGVAREERADDDAGPMLDGQAKAEYRRRITALEEELEEAESFNDPERADRAREELEFLAAELRAAVGLGGRDRKAASNAERARVNITRQIRGAIERIAGHDDSLGRLLEGTIRTGTFCEYRTQPGAPEWQVVA